MANGKVNCNCSILLTKIQTKEYMIEKNFLFESDLDKYYAYIVGILRITSFSNCPFEANNKINDKNSIIKSNVWNVNVMRFLDVPDNVDTTHNGICLYYKAVCTECGDRFDSFICNG
jgi:hypothetical protein